MPRGELDVVLRRLEGSGRAVLAPEADPRTLTAADHAAAVLIGGEEQHLLALNPV